MGMKSFYSAFLMLLIFPALLFSCSDDAKENVSKTNKKIEKVDQNEGCDDFWAVYNPDDSVKIRLLEDILKNEKSLSNANIVFLKAIVEDMKQERSVQNLPMIFEYPLFPIHRMGKNQIGVLGYSIAMEVNGQWEDFSKEDQLLSKDFGYQSIDSMGKLVYFPKVYDKLYPLSKPSIYWYSLKKKGKSNLPKLAYMGGECLSYFQYDLNLTQEEEQENIVFGSPYSLDLEFLNKSKLDALFKHQFQKKCLDCPTNYGDQKIFAQLKGTNIYFTQADSWPINDKLDAPSRSMVIHTKERKLITLWNSELDLFGCGCL
jgi:hypothetical protein